MTAKNFFTPFPYTETEDKILRRKPEYRRPARWSQSRRRLCSRQQFFETPLTEGVKGKPPVFQKILILPPGQAVNLLVSQAIDTSRKEKISWTTC
jgi:hypothetical protein